MKKTRQRPAKDAPEAGIQMISFRVQKEDLKLAKQQAEKKGLPYQTYLRSLIHQALQEAK